MVGNRFGVGLTRSTTRHLLPSLFPVKGASNLRPHGSKPPVARTGQHPWVDPGWKNLPTRISYCSNTNGDRRFRCEDNNVALTNVQSHYYRVRQVEPCHPLWLNSMALILSILALGTMLKQQHAGVLVSTEGSSGPVERLGGILGDGSLETDVQLL